MSKIKVVQVGHWTYKLDMTKDTKEKIVLAKSANRERMKGQTVTVDGNWRILRADPLNWEIRYKGKFQGYFGTISSAIRALPAKMLNEEAKGSLSEVLRTVEGISAAIDKAIP